MRLLIDTSIGPSVARRLVGDGHDVVRVGAVTPDPGDDAILARGARERRIVVTADKDFGELALHHGRAHAGIVRILDHPIARHPATVSAAIQRYGADLMAGALVTVEPGRVRVRPA